jgi:hypothetical protein
MTKIRTLNELQSRLDRDISWRVKEIANLKLLIKQRASISESTLLRAGMTLLYAHWEGFVKSSAQSYLDFINTQGYRYEQLTDCFVAMGVKRRLREMENAKRATVHIAAISFIRTAMGERAEIRSKSAIDTESNLSSSVFENIARTIGLEITRYEARFNLIDESLLARRNRIAHGEYLDIDADGWRGLADEVIQLMREVKTDIENSANLSRFLRVGAPVESTASFAATQIPMGQ